MFKFIYSGPKPEENLYSTHKMFKFNFFPESSENAAENVMENQESKVTYRSAKEHTISKEKYKKIAENSKSVDLFTSENGKFEAIYIDFPENLQVEEEFTANSDLVNGIYEGGLKIWEATADIVNFFEKVPNFEWKDKKILDMGCGSGILGIYAMRNCATIDFQDYNKEVIENVTIPTVIDNIEIYQTEKCWKHRFFSGDWDSFVKLLENEDKYDVILTAETIYNPNYYSKILNLFKCRLSRSGVIYLAAKVFYFGCNGSLRDFEKLMETDGTFSYQTVFKVEKDVFREVLEIKFKN